MARFARAYGLNYTSLIMIRNKSRPLSADFAREIEHAVGLPSGWMDTRHNALPGNVHDGIAARACAPDEADRLDSRRLSNVHWLVGDQRGAKARFCAHVGWAESRFQAMAARAFGQLKARNLESKLKLPQGWLDQVHARVSLPLEFEDRLAFLQELHGSAAAPQPLTSPAGSEARIQSPVVRALVEKLTALALENKVPELKALQLLNEVMELDRT